MLAPHLPPHEIRVIHCYAVYPQFFFIVPQNKSAGAFSGAFVIIAFVIIYKSEHIIYT